MAINGRPDPTGRSSGKLTGKQGKANRPPDKVAWVWLTRPLLASQAMRSRSLYARMMFDALLVDHMSHAGQCNGSLMATFEQLTAVGIPRKFIPATIAELDRLGLVAREHIGGRDDPSRYRLTCFGVGLSKPTDDWLVVTEDEAKAVAQEAKLQRRRSRGTTNTRFNGPQAGTELVPTAGTGTGTRRGNLRAV